MNINIVFQYFDPTKGGIENTAYYLYEELSKTYSMRGVSMEVDVDLKIKGVTYFPKSHAGLKYFIERNKWQFRNSLDADNTYNIGMTWFNAVGAYRAKKKYGTPYLCLVHGDDVYFNSKDGSVKDKLIRKVKKVLAKRVLENADVLCINSKNTQEILHKTITNTREIIIHPGINFVELNTAWHRKNQFVIFSIGRHVERKGFRNVLLAMPELRKIIPNVKYYLAGDGPLRREFETIVKERHLEGCVEFLGRIDEAEKYKRFQESDILLMPSFEVPAKMSIEGFGIVYLEANMAGRYAVGTNSGGIPDAIVEGITGHLMKDAEPETIVKDIYEIYCKLDDLYTQQLIDKRVEWARKHSFKNIAAQYEEVMFSKNSHSTFW